MFIILISEVYLQKQYFKELRNYSKNVNVYVRDFALIFMFALNGDLNFQLNMLLHLQTKLNSVMLQFLIITA